MNDTPGAGRYNLESKLEEKKGNAFGRGKRASFVSSNVAGVGDYNIVQQSKKKMVQSFGHADRFKKEEGSQPGPGDYHMHSTIGYRNLLKNK